MNKDDFDTQKIKEKISKGLHLTFLKLVRQKKADNGFLIVSEKGQIKKVKASDIN